MNTKWIEIYKTENKSGYNFPKVRNKAIIELFLFYTWTAHIFIVFLLIFLLLPLLLFFLLFLLLVPLSFDLVAIGGISVVLLFDRSPFLSEKRTLWLPWNQFVVVEKVIMQRITADTPSCDISNFISPNPIVLPSPLTSFGGSCPERGTIVPELQVGILGCKSIKL